MSKGRRQEFPRHEVVSGLREGGRRSEAQCAAERAFSCRLSELAGGPRFSGTAMRRGLGNKSIGGKERLQRRGIGCLVTTGLGSSDAVLT